MCSFFDFASWQCVTIREGHTGHTTRILSSLFCSLPMFTFLRNLSFSLWKARELNCILPRFLSSSSSSIAFFSLSYEFDPLLPSTVKVRDEGGKERNSAGMKNSLINPIQTDRKEWTDSGIERTGETLMFSLLYPSNLKWDEEQSFSSSVCIYQKSFCPCLFLSSKKSD